MNKVKIYEEIKEILLTSNKPSKEIKIMIEEGKFECEPFNKIVKLKDIEQNLKFHKEGNVFNHTMLVIDKASELKEKSNDKLVLMLSALLHDIGKLTTTKMRKGKWTSYNHDKVSHEMVYEFLEGLEDKIVIDKVAKLTLFHMQSLFFRNGLSLKMKNDIMSKVKVDELILLTMADRTGRLGIDEKDEINSILEFEKFLKAQ